MVSASDVGNAVTAGDNRGVEFDQYPSELISQALVYKTPDAQLVAQGLAGTVDLRTIRPLAFGEQTVSLSASYEYNSNGELNDGFDDVGYRLTGTYVDQFANDTVGIVLSIADQNTPTQGEKYEICNWEQRSGAWAPECFKMFSESRDLDRTAYLGTLEYEPNATLNTTLDVLYTDFADAGVRRGAEFPLGTWLGGATGLELLGAQVEDGLVAAGTFDNVLAVGRNDIQEREAELFSIGWNVQWRPFENWLFEGDLSHSRVERTALDFESYAGLGAADWGNLPFAAATDRLDFAFDGDRYRFSSQVGDGYADPALMVLTDPSGWGQDGFRKSLNTDDQLSALRLSATREFDIGVISSIEGGVYLSNREKERETIEDFVDLAGGLAERSIPAEYLLNPTDISFVSNVQMIAYDPAALLRDGIYELRQLNPAFIVGKQWQVEEDVATAYLQVNIDAEGRIPVRGNAGMQVVQTDQSSSGPTALSGTVLGRPNTGGDTYTDVLPSLNLAFELTENTFFRFGAARTVARARMDDMRASSSVSQDTGVCSVVGGTFVYVDRSDVNRYCISGDGGNPQLEPYRANSFDYSLEHYFAEGSGYVSIAYYYKEIDNWVVQGQSQFFDASAIIDAQFGEGTAAANPGIERARFSAPQNLDGGWIRGWEFAVNLPVEAVLSQPGLLEGFGVFASFSLTDSEIQPPTAAEPLPIPGLSEELGNITAYWERGPWEARISNRFRSDFIGELPDFTGQPDFRRVYGESVVDAQIGYEIVDGPASGLTIQLQANNLTDERFGTYLTERNGMTLPGDPERFARNWEEYGTTYTLRVSYRR